MDLDNEDARELNKVTVDVLKRMFEGLQKNAIAYKNLEDSSSKLF